MTPRTNARTPKRHLGRPRGSNSEATRARILAAARVCFARTGYSATTNKQIADDAGVTAAAIYLYFESKTALYLAAVQDANEQLVVHYRQAIAQTSTLRDGFRAVLTTSAKLHQRDPSLSAFLSALPIEMQRHPEVARAIIEKPSEVVGVIQEMVDAGVRSGEIARAIAPTVLSTFVACAMGFSLFFGAVDGSRPVEMVDVFIALLDGELFAEGTPRRGRNKTT
jgi:AcrR family transcriptional regulator